MRLRFGLLSLAVLAGMGCGDDGGGGGPSLADGPYADTVDAFCDLLDRCPDLLGFPIAYRNRNECKNIVDFSIGCELVEITEDDFTVQRRAIDITREEAEACIAYLEGVACGDYGGEDVPCIALFDFDDDEDGDGPTPMGALGDRCNRDDDCDDELYCHQGGLDSDRFQSICNVCTPRAAVGEPCFGARRDCQEGLHCDGGGAAGPRVCTAGRADGAECTGDIQCASGYCDHDMSPTAGLGLCDSGGNVGDPCVERCRAGNYCDDGTCAEQLAAGTACTDSRQCRSFGCNDGLCGSPDGGFCEEDADCIGGDCARGVCGGPADGSCSDDADCGDGEVCLWSSDSCGAPQPDGSSCQRDEECVSGLCNGDDQCASPAAIGDPCRSFSNDCGFAAYCADGVCAELADPGEACEGIQSCKLPFLCQDGRCRLPDLTCEPASAGEQCALFRVCDDESWCDLVGGIVCRPRFERGEECTPSLVPGIQVCAVGSQCLAGDDGVSRCLAQGAEGEPCGEAGCVDGTYCEGGTCVAGAVGQECDPFSGADPCPDPLVCDQRDEICIPPKGEGEDCDSSQECATGLWCEFDCAPRLGEGESCNRFDECLEDLYCETGGDRSFTCLPRLPVGSACDRVEEPCVAGSWCSTITDTCDALKPDGADCEYQAECQSDICDLGVCLSSAMCVNPF